MIVYEKDAFGINLLFRVHGSAVYRAIIPALCSVGFFVIIQFLWDERAKSEILHPYACGLLIGGITFLIIFRLTQSYGRYWEAASAVFRMQSKFMDGTVHVSNFHMQSAQYDKIKPSRFIDHPELDAEFLTRDRERLRPSHQNSGLNGKISSQRAVAKSINAIGNLRMKKRQNLSKKNNNNEQSDRSIGSCVSANGERSENFQMILTTCFQSAEPQQGSGVDLAKDDTGVCNHENPRFLTGDPKMDGGWGILFNDDKSTYRDPRDPSKVGFKGFASLLGGRTPPLFLQELAHLASLLNAVALSTLRNDIEGVESPLGLYEPGSQWPPVDPGQIADFHDTKLEGVWQALLYFMGKGRSPEDRTKYNASRPLPVLGGVSDAEIHMLQMARGPLAKTQLCWSWLSEFMNRASIEGSLGPCGQALISRTNQFLSDGMMAYSDARKVMFIPFPFPHSQHSSLFVNIMIFIIPLMMDQYTGDAWLGCMLTFLSVMCLSGIHEVARELENPFRNVPNELPLVTFQAQFNEALIIMYAGYHPDSYWHPPAKCPTSSPSTDNSCGTLRHISEGDNSDGEEEIEEEIRDRVDSLDKSNGINNETSELVRLRGIVEKQGKIMEKMLQEQCRLNETMQQMMSPSKKGKTL